MSGASSDFRSIVIIFKLTSEHQQGPANAQKEILNREENIPGYYYYKIDQKTIRTQAVHDPMAQQRMITNATVVDSIVE